MEPSFIGKRYFWGRAPRCAYSSSVQAIAYLVALGHERRSN